MAAERDVENNQIMFLPANDPASQRTGRGTQIAKLHNGLSLVLQEQGVVDLVVTVLRADNVPIIKKYGFLKRKLFVTVSNPEKTATAKTADVRVEGQIAKWNQSLDAFLAPTPSHLTLCLYAKRSRHLNTLIGTHEMRIPAASQSDIPCVIENDGGEAAQSTQPVTLYITVNITRFDPHRANESMKRIVQ